MFGKQPWLVASDELPEPTQMIFVQRAIAADRQAEAVERQRILLADGRKVAMRRPSRTHVVLGMDLEETDIRRRIDDQAIVLGLEPYSPAWWDSAVQMRRRKRHGLLR